MGLLLADSSKSILNSTTMRYLSLLLLLFACTCVSAQCDNSTELDQQARVAYLTNDMTSWESVLANAKSLSDNPSNQLQLARLALGAAGTAMAKQNDDFLSQCLTVMETSLDKFWESDKKDPAANGLYSAYLGLLIAQSPMKGMLYGSKSSKYAAKGVAYDANSPEAQYCLGSNLFYTPETWGGDAELAVEHLQAAIAATNDEAGCDWFHLQTLALLGQAQNKAGDTAGARMTYLKALQLEPEFGYVAKVLLPALSK